MVRMSLRPWRNFSFSLYCLCILEALLWQGCYSANHHREEDRMLQHAAVQQHTLLFQNIARVENEKPSNPNVDADHSVLPHDQHLLFQRKLMDVDKNDQDGGDAIASPSLRTATLMRTGNVGVAGNMEGGNDQDDTADGKEIADKWKDSPQDDDSNKNNAGTSLPGPAVTTLSLMVCTAVCLLTAKAGQLREGVNTGVKWVKGPSDSAGISYDKWSPECLVPPFTPPSNPDSSYFASPSPIKGLLNNTNTLSVDPIPSSLPVELQYAYSLEGAANLPPTPPSMMKLLETDHKLCQVESSLAGIRNLLVDAQAAQNVLSTQLYQLQNNTPVTSTGLSQVDCAMEQTSCLRQLLVTCGIC